ncbi:MAG TPA: DUF2141 domain-containing protein [Azospirillaceae bacterium]|nr:DUF2141 domain-containing protein [Azospirillaceae bacterium]
MTKLLSTLALVPALLAGPGWAADLTVRIEGVRSATGNVVVCLWDAPATFPDCGRSQPVQVRSLPAAEGTVAVRFPGLPPGTYAVSVLHDENGNNRMDTNFLGIPREGFGASNLDRLPRAAAPTFDDARFELRGDGTVTAWMLYP